MQRDFTEFGITNPEQNGNIWDWQIEVNWIVLRKLHDLECQECPFEQWKAWGKVSLVLLGALSMLGGLTIGAIRLLGG